MGKFNTVTDMLLEYRHIEDRGITYILNKTDEVFVSYADLYKTALRYLGALQEKGMKPGDELIFQTDDNEQFLYLFWACLLGGMIPVPITVGAKDEHRMKLFRIWEVLNNPYLAIDQDTFAPLERFANKKNLTDKIVEIKSKTAWIDQMKHATGEGTTHLPQPQDIAFLQFSSGSTGDPKGVILTHERLTCNIWDLNKRYEHEPTSVGLSWMPLTHDMGLIAAYLTHFAMGMNQYMMSSALFIRQPNLLMQKAHEHRCTHLYAPNFAYYHFLSFYKPEIAKDWDLSCIRMLMNAAEPISGDLCREFNEVLGRHGFDPGAMYPGYGLAEACVGVSFGKVGAGYVPIDVDRRYLGIGEQIVEVDRNETSQYVTFVECGYALDSTEMRIADEENNVLPDNTVGYLHIRGGNVTHGYYNNPEATARLITSDGWANTGDVGFLRDGKFVIIGRHKDVLIVNGENYHAHDLERVAEEVEGCVLNKVAVVGVYDHEKSRESIVFFVAHKKKDLTPFITVARNLKRVIAEKVGLEVKEVIPVIEIPQTTSGKMQRYKLRQWYTEGQFEEVIRELKALMEAQEQLTEEDRLLLPGRLLQVTRDALGISLGLNDNFFEVGADSMQLVQLAAKLEQVFHRTVQESDLFVYPTIRKLAESWLDGDRINLDAVTLPSAFWANGQGGASGLLEVTLDADVTGGLHGIAQELSLESFDILAGLFAFVLGDMAGVTQLPLQMLHGKADVVTQVSLELQQSEDVAAFLAEVAERRANAEVRYPLHRVSKIVMPKGEEMLPLVYGKAYKTSHADLLGTYDLVLAIDETAGNFTLSCEYNGRRLNKDKVRDLLEGVTEVAGALAGQYQGA